MYRVIDDLRHVFSADGFLPRRVCGSWPAWLAWEHIIGNALVWLAYIALPLLFLRLEARRSIWVPFKGLVRAFAMFIGLCGLSHLLEMMAFFHPLYRLSGHVLIATGVASWGTVWILFRAWPTILSMKSPIELERVVDERTRELARANLELREGDSRFRLLAESIPQLAWMARPDGHIFWFNQRWFDYTGTTLDEMKGWGWQSALDPGDIPQVVGRWQESIAVRTPFEMVFPIRGAGGQLREFLTLSVPFYDKDGRLILWFGTNTDVEELKHAEGALRESEERLQLLNETLEARVRERTAAVRQQSQLIDMAHDAILVRTASGLILSWNQGAEREYGWSKEEAIGSISHDLLETQFSVPLSMIEDDLEEFGSWSGEMTQHRRDGSSLVVASRWVLDREADGPDERIILEIHNDLTIRKASERAMREAKEAAEAASRVKSEFLANMSHEIRTPMNGVLGMTELLLDSQLNDLQRSYAETIRGSGEALLTVINDILDFSKIEAGKLSLELAGFDLRTLMEEVADLLAPRARQKGLEVSCRVARDVPGRLIGDPIRIRQVLTNLVGNAVKFTDRGEVELEARLIARDEAGARLRILVRDTGVGIPEEFQSHIFESFTQIEGGNSRRHGGTGLGLAICRSLVALMDGRIGLESRPGEGSTFWFEVVLGRGPAVEDGFAARLDDLRLLVIEDLGTDREDLRQTLRSWDCRTEVADSGAEALAMLLSLPEDDPFGLILIDQDMPNLDAEQTARLIKAAPRFAAVPIVMLTSHSPPGADEPDDGPWAARVMKPLRRSHLYNTLSRVMLAPSSPRAPTTAVALERLTVTPPLRILLAEDNEVNRRVAIGMAERLGCEVDAVCDGREAVAALDFDRHDLILMDVQMPEMDGFAATAAIRQRENGTGRHIPIIALTAHAMHGDRQRCLDAGMDGYLAKPIRPELLRDVLRKWAIKGESTCDVAAPDQVRTLRSFSAERLAESCGDDPGLTREVLVLLLESAPGRMDRLRAAFAAGDGRTVSREAHNLKGAFATVGAEALAVACQELMVLGERGDFPAIERCERLIREGWELLQAEVDLYLAKILPADDAQSR